MNSVKELAEEYFDYAVSMRREFHMHPEPSMKEKRTSRRIIEELEKLGLEAKNAAGTGVVSEIKGGKKSASNKTVALRADMDALELEEKNEVEYKSKNEGLMHGCGHDGHSASLLTAAKILNDLKEEFAGTVKLIFQPGEEIAVGAKTMVEEGVVEDVDAILGIHIWNDLESGKISVEAGPRMAAVNQFIIKVKGKGGHGSMPHQAVDPIVMASSFILESQAILSRETDSLDPVVFTLGKMKSGSRFNVIPDKAEIVGTLRCFKEKTRNEASEAIKRYADKIAKSYRGEAEVEIRKGTPPTINDQRCTEIAQAAARKIAAEDILIEMEKTPGSEDMAYYLREVPGVIAFVGAAFADESKNYPHHNSRFNINEESLKQGTELYFNFALEFLEQY